MRNKLDISAYFVVGPENTNGRPVAPIIRDAVGAGFTVCADPVKNSFCQAIN